MLIFLQAVIKNLLSIFCRCPSKVKLSIYILQNTSFSSIHSSKKTLFSRQIAAIFHLTHLLFCLFLGPEPAFCTILPFYFGCQLIIFCAQLHAFCPKKTHFLTAILPFSAIFLMVVKGLFIPIAVDFYAFHLAFSSILHCI